jgi:hypothetical protein
MCGREVQRKLFVQLAGIDMVTLFFPTTLHPPPLTFTITQRPDFSELGKMDVWMYEVLWLK